MKIGIFGGAFNPPHLGHIQSAKLCIDFLKLDKLLIIPSGKSPHKSNEELVENKYRFEMCRLAFENSEKCEICDIELNDDELSYSYITIKKLKALFPNDEFIMICGSDMYLSLLSWKNPQYIFDNVSICGFVRNKEKLAIMENQKKVLASYGANTVIADFEILPYSSTKVRYDIKHNNEFCKFLDKSVYNYIKENNLYL